MIANDELMMAECDMMQLEKECAPRSMMLNMSLAAPAMEFKKMNRDLERMAGEYNDGLMEKKKQFKPGFQNLDKTKEYVERTYYGKTDTVFTSLIPLSPFWSDLAEHVA